MYQGTFSSIIGLCSITSTSAPFHRYHLRQQHHIRLWKGLSVAQFLATKNANRSYVVILFISIKTAATCWWATTLRARHAVWMVMVGQSANMVPVCGIERTLNVETFHRLSFPFWALWRLLCIFTSCYWICTKYSFRLSFRAFYAALHGIAHFKWLLIYFEYVRARGNSFLPEMFLKGT